MKLTDGFNQLAAAPDGIKCLRELIFSLAVQGKLVPQEPNDIPACELLKQIRAEKDRLIAEGKIKKVKPLPAITGDEKPFELPQGWEWIRLGDVSSRVQYGFTASADYSIDMPKMLRITDIQDNRVDWDNVPGVNAEGKDLTSYFLEVGDLLIARTGGTIGKTFLVNEAPCDSVFASYLIRVSPLKGIASTYLKLFALSDLYWRQLLAKSMGTGQPNVNGTSLAGLVMPLPNQSEQSRIVAKVEELMGLCDSLEARGKLEAEQHARLTAALFDALAASKSAHQLQENWARLASNFDLVLDRPEAVDELEQALLQLAMRGLLVEQDPSDEPASELLKRICAEKDCLIVEGKIKKDKPLPAISDDEKPFDLPQGWEWVRFGSLINSSEAGWSPSCDVAPREGDFWGVLKVSAVSWGEFRSYENKALPLGLTPRPEIEVKAGDFLLSRANTEGLVARSVIADNPEPRLMMSDKIIRLNLSSLVNPSFFNQVNNTTNSRAHYIEHASGTSSSMKNVSREVIMNLPVPLPPLAEQSRVVAGVEALRTLCASLRERLATSLKIQTNLAESLIESYQ
jgi:type I restriction enzyme S subunit